MTSRLQLEPREKSETGKDFCLYEVTFLMSWCHVIWLFSHQGSSENQKKGVEFLKPVFTNSPFIQAKKYKIAPKKPDSEQFEILKKENQESSFMFQKKHPIVYFFLNSKSTFFGWWRLHNSGFYSPQCLTSLSDF